MVGGFEGNLGVQEWTIAKETGNEGLRYMNTHIAQWCKYMTV